MIRRKLKNLIKDKSGASLIYVLAVGAFLILITGSLVILSSVTASELTRKQRASQLQLYAQSFVQTLNVELNKKDSALANEIILRMYQDNNTVTEAGETIEYILTSKTKSVKEQFIALNSSLPAGDRRSSVELQPVTANISMSIVNPTNGLIGNRFGAVQISDARGAAPTYTPTNDQSIKFYIRLKDSTLINNSPNVLNFEMTVPIRIEIIPAVAGPGEYHETYTANAKFVCVVKAEPTKTGTDVTSVTISNAAGDNKWDLVEFE